jgi:hypothetical protein
VFHHSTDHTQSHGDFIRINVSIIILRIIIITSYFIATPFKVLISVVAISFGLFLVTIIHFVKIIMIIRLDNLFFVVLFEIVLFLSRVVIAQRIGRGIETLDVVDLSTISHESHTIAMRVTTMGMSSSGSTRSNTTTSRTMSTTTTKATTTGSRTMSSTTTNKEIATALETTTLEATTTSIITVAISPPL